MKTKKRKPRVKWLDWHGCYDDGWKGLIVDEAFAHPAKASRALVRKIFDYMEAQGWLTPRSRVLDVFGGIGTTAIEGASRGHEVVCVELEDKFVGLARENFELHRRVWEASGDPLPVILHGDSRKAVELVRGHFGGCVGSPPFAGCLADVTDRKETKMVRRNLPSPKDVAAYLKERRLERKLTAREVDRQLGTVTLYSWYEGRPAGIEMPTPEHWLKLKTILGLDDRFDAGILNVEEVEATSKNATDKTGHAKTPHYGQTPGQIGAMPEGSIDAAIGSPPFSGTEQPCASQTRAKKDYHAFTRGDGTKRDATMTGDTKGQLGAMKEGDVDVVLGSPPYADQATNGAREKRADNLEAAGIDSKKWLGKKRCTQGHSEGYGSSDGQLGDTFWQAARAILEQVFQLVRVGGMTAWIVKDYVKKGKRVEFCSNWCKLLEAVGFRVMQRVRCWLVKEETHAGLFGSVTKRTERKSFFRRLHERKPGAVKIDWEEVVFAVREEARQPNPGA